MKVFLAVITVLVSFLLGVSGVCFIEKRRNDKQLTVPQEP